MKYILQEEKQQETFREKMKRVLKLRRLPLKRLIEDEEEYQANKTEICYSESTAYTMNLNVKKVHFQQPIAPETPKRQE